ncbi:MAG: alpha/beta fold hydrolase [Pseudomonadota bacterium]
MRRLLLTTALIALAACNASPKVENEESIVNEGATLKAEPATPTALQFKAADGVTVFAKLYAAEQPKALILLFHQAESSKDEYAAIAPRLQTAGYSALAIDQRVGGKLFGPNQTMAGFTGKTDFLGTLPDLEGALAWAKANAGGKPIILWGSSYSASLVFLIAASPMAKDSVKGVVAFSPGEYFSDKKMIENAAAKITVPVFVDSASDMVEIAEAKAIVSATKSTDRQQYVPATGIHGSSTLNSGKNPGGAEENWNAVMAFLKRVAR